MCMAMYMVMYMMMYPYNFVIVEEPILLSVRHQTRKAKHPVDVILERMHIYGR